MEWEVVRRLAGESIAPDRFFVRSPWVLRCVHAASEETAWELFRGHLLDRSQTRQKRSFECWKLFLDAPGQLSLEPIIQVLLDEVDGSLYVVRSVEVYGWEAYSGAEPVIDGREVRKWQRELAGSIRLVNEASEEEIREGLATLVRRAVVGGSRLPITSLESPLPAYSLGWFTDLPAPMSRVHTDDFDVIYSVLLFHSRQTERVQALDFALRTFDAEQVEEMTARFARADAAAELVWLVKPLFHQLALSPAGNLIANLLHMLELLPKVTGDVLPAACTVGYMTRLLVRHLTAYDLVTFHNFGANYPDALFLDGLVRLLARWLEQSPELANDRRLRRALRQGWLMRRRCEGLPVPDYPTSPGENQRVMPPDYPRLSDDQLMHPHRRRKRLFSDAPSESLLPPQTRSVLRRAADDLRHVDELLELGMALFLDRPLGMFKERAAVDRTPLLSYEAFSRGVAAEKLAQLHEWGLIASKADYMQLAQKLARDVVVRGIAATEIAQRQRPGVVALEDSLRAAGDFVFTRTTTASLRDVVDAYDWSPLRAVSPAAADWFSAARRVLLIRTPHERLRLTPPAFLTAYDDALRPRFDLAVVSDVGQPPELCEYLGKEYLSQGFQLLRIWDGAGNEIFHSRHIRIYPSKMHLSAP